jgi:hypothetical protein
MQSCSGSGFFIISSLWGKCFNFSCLARGRKGIKSALLYQLSYELPKAFQYQGSTAELPSIPGGLQPYPFVSCIAKGTILAISSTAARMLLYSLKNLVSRIPVKHGTSGNKKVVREGNRQGVIVLANRLAPKTCSKAYSASSVISRAGSTLARS